MAAIQELGQITTITPSWSPGIVRTGIRMYDSYTRDYATIYRTQPNVRTCVDFLARNIAQLGLHVYRRVSDTDRQRQADHPLAQLFAQPLPAAMKVTRYRLFESLMSDLGIYFRAYWLKLRTDGQVSGLLRIPPQYMTTWGGLIPTKYELNLGGEPKYLAPDEIIHFRGYNPENPVDGLASMETLRRILAEEWEAGEYREYFWQNAARKSGIVKRPTTAPDWSDTARERFRADFEELYSGGPNSGKTVILEDGMEFQDATFNAQESEYLAGRKLTREECARAYHIPLPMVGILDNATLSNITEQHKNLYQDALGPWCVMIEEDVELQLLPEFDDSQGVYTEFNIAEKLRGSFEEQTTSLQAAVGRPWMTANEARARMNLPSLPGDADRLVTPLNVLVGGQASPQDSAPPPKMKAKADGDISTELAQLRNQHLSKWTVVFQRYYNDVKENIINQLMAKAKGATLEVLARNIKGYKTDLGGIWWAEETWGLRLFNDCYTWNNFTAQAWADYMFEQYPTEHNQEQFMGIIQDWIFKYSKTQSYYINQSLSSEIGQAIKETDPINATNVVFQTALEIWAGKQAIGAVTAASNYGSHEAANTAGLRKKRWRVNSKNPRDSHLALDGETVGIRDLFSNGLRWPGDPRGSAEDNANCQCTVDFLRGE